MGTHFSPCCTTSSPIVKRLQDSVSKRTYRLTSSNEAPCHSLYLFVPTIVEQCRTIVMLASARCSASTANGVQTTQTRSFSQGLESSCARESNRCSRVPPHNPAFWYFPLDTCIGVRPIGTSNDTSCQEHGARQKAGTKDCEIN